MQPCSDHQHQLTGREPVQQGMEAGQRSQISKYPWPGHIFLLHMDDGF